MKEQRSEDYRKGYQAGFEAGKRNAISKQRITKHITNIGALEPVVHAHWEEVYGYVTPGGDPVWVCSNCGKGMHVWGVEALTYNRDVSDSRQWVACPNCGAKMDLKEDK